MCLRADAQSADKKKQKQKKTCVKLLKYSYKKKFVRAYAQAESNACKRLCITRSIDQRTDIYKNVIPTGI